MPVLPFCSISQTADAIAFFIHRTDTNARAVDDEHLKLRHDALGYAKLDIAFKIKIGYYKWQYAIFSLYRQNHHLAID